MKFKDHITDRIERRDAGSVIHDGSRSRIGKGDLAQLTEPEGTAASVPGKSRRPIRGDSNDASNNGLRVENRLRMLGILTNLVCIQRKNRSPKKFRMGPNEPASLPDLAKCRTSNGLRLTAGSESAHPPLDSIFLTSLLASRWDTQKTLLTRLKKRVNSEPHNCILWHGSKQLLYIVVSR